MNPNYHCIRNTCITINLPVGDHSTPADPEWMHSLFPWLTDSYILSPFINLRIW